MKQSKIQRIAVVIGSDSDLPQCLIGMNYLMQAHAFGQVYVVHQKTMSIHRNFLQVFWYLLCRVILRDVDVIIAGAGWAAHLPGMMDAILGYVFKTQRIHIIGVAFEDPESATHTLAARLSISEVPGTRVLYQNSLGSFVGARGFLSACKLAASGGLPELAAMKVRPMQTRTLEQAIFVAQEAVVAAQNKKAAISIVSSH